MIDEISSQAGLSSFRGAPQPAPEAYTVYPTSDPDAVDVAANGIAQTIHREDADPEHRHTAYRLAAAYFGNLPQTPEPEPVTIYAAVIEWAGYDDSAPDLILARSERERFEKIKSTVRTEYQSREDSGQDWPEAFAILIEAEAAKDFSEWYEHAAWVLQDLSGGPTVATYEREV